MKIGEILVKTLTCLLISPLFRWTGMIHLIYLYIYILYDIIYIYIIDIYILYILYIIIMYLYLLKKFCICNCIYYDFLKSNCSSIYYKKKVFNCNCIYYIFCEYCAQLCIYIYIYIYYITSRFGPVYVRIVENYELLENCGVLNLGVF